jgi:hypothetical protein
MRTLHGNMPASSPVIGDTGVLIPAGDGQLWHCDYQNLNVCDWTGVGSVAITTGSVVFSQHAGTIYAYDESTGDLLWSNAELTIKSDLMPATDGTYVYAIGTGPGLTLYALSASTGTVAWSATNPEEIGNIGGVYNLPPVVTPDYVFTGGGNSILIYRASSGEFVWNITTDANIYSISLAEGQVLWGTESDFSFHAYVGGPEPAEETGTCYDGIWNCHSGQCESQTDYGGPCPAYEYIILEPEEEEKPPCGEGEFAYGDGLCCPIGWYVIDGVCRLCPSGTVNVEGRCIDAALLLLLTALGAGTVYIASEEL